MTSKAESEALATYWRQQIKAWESSGQSRKSFCEQHDLNYHRFGYWYQKFQRKVSAPASSESSKATGFIPVMAKHQTVNSGLSLVMPDGVVVQGIAQDNLNLVEQLLVRLS